MSDQLLMHEFESSPIGKSLAREREQIADMCAMLDRMATEHFSRDARVREAEARAEQLASTIRDAYECLVFAESAEQVGVDADRFIDLMQALLREGIEPCSIVRFCGRQLAIGLRSEEVIPADVVSSTIRGVLMDMLRQA